MRLLTMCGQRGMYAMIATSVMLFIWTLGLAHVTGKGGKAIPGRAKRGEEGTEEVGNGEL